MYYKVARIAFVLAVVWLVFCGATMKTEAVENLKEEQKKIIYILYDNSYSTFKLDGKSYNYWSEINYGVRAFYAMSNPEDEINIYYLATVGGAPRKSMPYQELETEQGQVLRTTDYGQNRVRFMDAIENIQIVEGDKSITYLDNVLYAIEKLGKEEEDAEKWIVLFTDGKLEDVAENEYGAEESANFIESKLKDYPDVQACYIPISDVAINDKFDKKLVYQPSETEDIAKQLLEVCNHIYGRRAISSVRQNGYETTVLQNGELSISFDIPISKCILYAYCDGIIEGEVRGKNILWQECIRTPDEPKFSDGNLRVGAVSEKKTGFIVELATDTTQNKSDYIITFPKNNLDIQYEIYYEPAFCVTPQVLQDRKDMKDGAYWAGDVEVALAFSNRETQEALAETAAFLSVEQFEVSVMSNGKKQSLTLTSESNRWQGSIAPGNAVITASTVGISGTTSAELYKNYSNAELVVTMDETYYMDQLGDRKQFIRVQAMLDGENITGEINDLLREREANSISFYLGNEERKCKQIAFEREYDTVVNCWKLYPGFVDKIDYSVSGTYDFYGDLVLKLNYYDADITVATVQEDSFWVGISNEEIEVQIENPWLCKIRNFFLSWADKAEISFLWNGQTLPAKVLENITLSGRDSSISYQITGINKDAVKLKSQRMGGFFLQPDAIDWLTVEGTAVLFGVECKIYDDSLEIEIQALSPWQRVGCLLGWAMLLAAVVIAMIKIFRYVRDCKKGVRFPLGTSVYRSYPNGNNRLKGRIYRRRKRDKKKIWYTEYTLSCYMPQEFRGSNGKWMKIKVRRHKRNLEILDIPKIIASIYLGDNEYTNNYKWMELDEKIKLKGDKSTIEIQLENY